MTKQFDTVSGWEEKEGEVEIGGKEKEKNWNGCALRRGGIGMGNDWRREGGEIEKKMRWKGKIGVG